MMSQENNNILAERSRDLRRRRSDMCDDLVLAVILNVCLLMKLDRDILVWLYGLCADVPLLKLIPEAVVTVLPKVLDIVLAVMILATYGHLLDNLGAAVGDCIKGSFADKAGKSWKWLYRTLIGWLAVFFARIVLGTGGFRHPLIRDIGKAGSEVFGVMHWDKQLVQNVGSILNVIGEALLIGICLMVIWLGVMLVAAGVRAVCKERSKPKEGPVRSKPRRGSSGLRSTVAADANARLEEFLTAMEPAQPDETYLRIQILDPDEIDRDRLYEWNDRNEIYVRLENYEMVFLREDGKAYLLGSEQLELAPNVPEVVYSQGRMKSKKLIVTYIE